jgi:hypothetical protein
MRFGVRPNRKLRKMNPAALPWWGWLLLAPVFWFAQLNASVYTDRGSLRAWIVRGTLIAGMVFSAALGVIRFVKWAWAS